MSGWDGDPERHEIAVRDINITGAIRLPADIADEQSAPEERVGGVGHLDLVRIRRGRVVEQGILLTSRSIRLTTATYETFSSVGCEMGCCCD